MTAAWTVMGSLAGALTDLRDRHACGQGLIRVQGIGLIGLQGMADFTRSPLAESSIPPGGGGLFGCPAANEPGQRSHNVRIDALT